MFLIECICPNGMHCPLFALFLVYVLRICCQRRLTRWWSGPLGVRSSGWMGTSSVALSRPHPGTTLSLSCSLPCSLKDSVLSAGMCTQWHTQDQCTWCAIWNNPVFSLCCLWFSCPQVNALHENSPTVKKSVSCQVGCTHTNCLTQA